jgi:hypothetical protein
MYNINTFPNIEAEKSEPSLFSVVATPSTVDAT